MAGIGEALRSTRERRGLSIAEVAQDTRISPRFLEALEDEQFDELPAPVYVRGFIRSYASYLKIESQPLLDQLVGGDPGSPAGRVGGSGSTTGANGSSRRTDPFQRSGVVPARGVRARTNGTPATQPAPPSQVEDPDSWAPEPPAPFRASPSDRGYIPGSDLMEAPEHPETDQGYDYDEPVPAYRARNAGVLAERPPSPGEPGVPRKVALFGVGVAAVLAFLALAVFLTRGNDDGGGPTNAAASNPSPGITPGSVIVASRSASPTASASPSAAVSATPSLSAGAAVTTTPGASTPSPTAGAQSTSTPIPTPTTVQTAAPTPTPTATATLPPATPTPTVGAPPHPSTISACDTNKESEKCGSSYVRVICYPPFAENDPTGKNNNYFVDVTGAYPLQPGWRETTVYAPVSIGPVIEAGRNSCL